MTNREIYNQAFQDLYNHCLLEEKIDEIGLHLDDSQGVCSKTFNDNYTFCYNLIYYSLGIKILEVKEKIPYNSTYLFAYPEDEDYDFLVPLDRLDDLIMNIRASELWQDLLWDLFVNKNKELISYFEQDWSIKFGVEKNEK